MKSLKLFSLLIAAVLLSTVALVISTAAEELPSVYVSQINKKVDYASGALFTKAFNGTNTIKSSEGNFRWTKQIVCKPTEKAGVYELVQDAVGNLKNGTNGDPDESLTIPEGGFIYAAHIDDREPAKADGTFERSKENQDKIANLKKGAKVTISGIDIANGTIQQNAVIYLGDASGNGSSSSSAPASSSSSAPASSSSSAPASSSSAATSSTSSQPQTGDEGVAYFAIAAMISLAGASVLSLKRRSR